MIPNHIRFPVAALAVLPDELDDLSRFEGAGGPEALVLATKLIDVPLENAIWRKPVRSAHQTKMTL